MAAYKAANDARLEKFEADFRKLRSAEQRHLDSSGELEANGWVKIDSDVSESLHYKVVTSKCTWQQAFIECKNLGPNVTLAQTLTATELRQAYSNFRDLVLRDHLHLAGLNAADPTNLHNYVWVISGRRVDSNMIKDFKQFCDF